MNRAAEGGESAPYRWGEGEVQDRESNVDNGQGKADRDEHRLGGRAEGGPGSRGRRPGSTYTGQVGANPEEFGGEENREEEREC